MQFFQSLRAFQQGMTSLLIGILCLGLSFGGHAATIEGVEFDDQTIVDGQELQLASLARLYYKIIFTGAVAGLYLNDKQHLDNVLADVPKRLEFFYFGGVDAEDFVEAANESLAKNLNTEKLENIRQEIDAFNSLYVDIEKNDRYAISYIPGGGLQLAHNGEVLGEVGDAEFAAAYFTIWFGDKPFNSHLKTNLLEGNE